MSAVATTVPTAWAQDPEPYEGPLLLSVLAPGGWDPTLLCDPKGQRSEQDVSPVNRSYRTDEIRSPDAPSPLTWAPGTDNEAFFTAHHDKLVIVNGLNTATNNHDLGQRLLASGRLRKGLPSLGALLAASAGPLPLGFLTYGGYDATADLTARTRIGSLETLDKIVRPNTMVPSDTPFFPDSTLDRIQEVSRRRLARARDAQRLPRLRRGLDALSASRGGGGGLRQLENLLPDLGGFSTAIGRQGALVIAAYRAGLTAAANLVADGVGFDSHSNNDTQQPAELGRLLRGAAEVWQEVERHGLEERVSVVVHSDFGRTPFYNAGNGKDHWPVTSVMVMGGGAVGNRVVGATDDAFAPLAVDPQTLEPSEGGVVLTPGHLHAALRDHLGIATGELAQRFPIDGELLPLFG